MSLINSMLRDLDARKSDGPGGQFEGQVRAVPRQEKGSPQRWGAVAGAVLVLGAAGAAGAMWLRSSAKQAPPAVAKVAPPVAMAAAAVQAPVAAPVPVSAPVVATAAPVESVAATVVSVAAPAADAPAPMEKRSAPAEPKPPPAKLKVVEAESIKAPAAIKASEPTAQERADTAYTQALDLQRQGKGDAANTALEQALRLNSRHGAARHALLSGLIDEGRKDEAMRLAQDGLAVLPAQPAIAMTLARLQVEKGELRLAIATLERSLPFVATASASAPGYEAFLAALLQRDDQHKQAVDQYLVALKKAPDAGVWWMGLGISYQALQRPLEAADAYRRAKASGALSAELVAFVDGRLGQLQR
jgi:MSHA biogenesis protein MshN